MNYAKSSYKVFGEIVFLHIRVQSSENSSFTSTTEADRRSPAVDSTGKGLCLPPSYQAAFGLWMRYGYPDTKVPEKF